MNCIRFDDPIFPSFAAHILTKNMNDKDEPVKILLADDDKDDQELFSDALAEGDCDGDFQNHQRLGSIAGHRLEGSFEIRRWAAYLKNLGCKACSSRCFHVGALDGRQPAGICARDI